MVFETFNQRVSERIYTEEKQLPFIREQYEDLNEFTNLFLKGVST